MAKSTVVAFELPSEFSPDPLTEVIQKGAQELLRTAVLAEVSAFIAEHAHLLDEDGRQSDPARRVGCCTREPHGRDR